MNRLHFTLLIEHCKLIVEEAASKAGRASRLPTALSASLSWFGSLVWAGETPALLCAVPQ